RSNTPWQWTMVLPSFRRSLRREASSYTSIHLDRSLRLVGTVLISLPAMLLCCRSVESLWLAEQGKPIFGFHSDGFRIPHRSLTPVVDILENPANSFFKRNFRLPSQYGFNLADVCERAIRFARPFWNMNRAAAKKFD